MASRHFYLAAATPLPAPAVVEVDDVEADVELLEVPQALTAAAVTTSTTRIAQRRSIMPPSSRKTSPSSSTGARRGAEKLADNI